MVVGATVGVVVAAADDDDYHETSTVTNVTNVTNVTALASLPCEAKDHGCERNELLPVRFELVHARLPGRRSRLRSERPTAVEVRVKPRLSASCRTNAWPMHHPW